MAAEHEPYESLLGRIGDIAGERPGAEVETPLDVMEEGASGREVRAKIPLEKAKNLNDLRRAAQEIAGGTMTPEEYRSIILKILKTSDLGVQLFDTDVVRNKENTLPPDEAQLVEKMRQAFKAFNQGVMKMAKFLEKGDQSLVQEGLAEAEAAMIEIDRVQDLALEIANSR